MKPALKISDITSQLDVESIGEDYIKQVRAFGSLGYSPERIASLLSLTGRKKTVLIVRINTPGDTYNTAYFYGKSAGEWNIDTELAKKAEKGDIDSITLLQERKDDRRHLDLRRDLFGH